MIGDMRILDCICEHLPDKVLQHRRKDMEEKGGEFVDAVEDQRVVPEEDGDAEGPKGEGEVGVEPHQVVGEEEGLRHARDVDQVAEVQHEEL